MNKITIPNKLVTKIEFAHYEAFGHTPTVGLRRNKAFTIDRENIIKIDKFLVVPYESFFFPTMKVDYVGTAVFNQTTRALTILRRKTIDQVTAEDLCGC